MAAHTLHGFEAAWFTVPCGESLLVPLIVCQVRYILLPRWKMEKKKTSRVDPLGLIYIINYKTYLALFPLNTFLLNYRGTV